MPDADYFDVELKGGAIVLRPLRFYDTDLEKVRAKVRRLGLTQDSVAKAIEWARSK